MASESESWWSQHYQTYSIRDLQALPIFNKFIAMHYPFQRSTVGRSESFSSAGSLDEYQWSVAANNEGEKFTHDRTTDVWFYEHRFQDKEAHTTVRAWLSPSQEWGEIERNYLTYVLREAWKLEDSIRFYERYTLQDGEKRGLKTGCLPAQGGMEQWTETYWEKEGESEFEKVWERPGSSGGENKHNRGDYWWGEVWHRSEDSIEKKAWHTKGDKDWGHVHGEGCDKVWDEKWDTSKGKREEEKLVKDSERHRGFRYKREGKDWYKQEWDGLAILGVDEDLERLKKAEVRQDLDEISSNCHDTLLKGEHTIELLLRSVPHFKAEVDDLQRERIAIPKPDSQDVNSLITAIRAERDHADKQERLKQRMIDEVYSDHGKYYELHLLLEKLLKQSHGTLQHISEMLETDGKLKEDVADWGKRIEEIPKKRNVSSFGKDLVYVENIEELEKTKLVHLAKLQAGAGGIPKEEVENAMNLLYQIMVKHDAVSDKIVELVPDSDLKVKLDGFEDQFETIHKRFQEQGDPKLLLENLDLLLAYQPIHLHLMGRIRGYNKDEVSSEIGTINTAVDETKGKPSLKNTRAKVRSGRGPKDTPFQLIDRNLNRLIPFLAKVNDVVRAKENLQPLLDIAKEKVDDGQPFEVIFKKADLLLAVVVALEPKIDLHEEKVRALDGKLDGVLSQSLELMEDEDKAIIEAITSRHYADEDVDLLQEKLEMSGGLSTETVTTMETEIKGLKETIEELEMIIEQKSEEIQHLSKVVDENKKKVQILEDEVLDLRRYKAMFEDRDNQCSALEARNKKLDIESSDLKLALDSAKSELETLRSQVDDLAKFKQTALDNAQEIDRLKGIIASYDSMLGDRKAQFEEIVGTLNNKIAELEAKIRELLAKIEEMKTQLDEKETGRRRQLMLRIISALANTLKTERFSTFLLWRSRADEPVELLSVDTMDQFPEVKPTVMDDEQEFTDPEVAKFIDAEKPLLNTRRKVLAENTVFRHLRATGLPFEPAMPLQEFGEMVEEILEKKMKADEEDLANKKVPADLPSFMLDSLLHSKGIKRLAQRDLLRFIPTLHRLFHSNSPFGEALSRLMLMFHHNPMIMEGAILAVKYSQLFRPLGEKYLKEREARQVPAETAGNLVSTGGLALLIDVLNQFYPILKDDDISLWHFLRQIKPAKCSTEDYVLAVLHWFSHTQKHQDHHQFWEALAHGKTELTQDEFVGEVIAWECTCRRGY